MIRVQFPKITRHLLFYVYMFCVCFVLALFHSFLTFVLNNSFLSWRPPPKPFEWWPGLKPKWFNCPHLEFRSHVWSILLTLQDQPHIGKTCFRHVAGWQLRAAYHHIGACAGHGWSLQLDDRANSLLSLALTIDDAKEQLGAMPAATKKTPGSTWPIHNYVHRWKNTTLAALSTGQWVSSEASQKVSTSSNCERLPAFGISLPNSFKNFRMASGWCRLVAHMAWCIVEHRLYLGLLTSSYSVCTELITLLVFKRLRGLPSTFKGLRTSDFNSHSCQVSPSMADQSKPSLRNLITYVHHIKRHSPFKYQFSIQPWVVYLFCLCKPKGRACIIQFWYDHEPNTQSNTSYSKNKESSYEACNAHWSMHRSMPIWKERAHDDQLSLVIETKENETRHACKICLWLRLNRPYLIQVE